ncbi:MAG: dTMP kinase [Rhizobiales bacterium]|nr:dTMP kinase [Hyphomicrobiales bacterium]
MSSRGRFITLEGGEGTGKSTQTKILGEWLRERGVDVLLTREPGGTPRAEALRELLLLGRIAPFGAEAEALVFAVARAEHLAESIRPALKAGTWVISDRFLDSTRAYQGTSGVAPDVLDRLERISVGEDRPDLTLVLDLPAELGIQRIRARANLPDRFEGDGLGVHEARSRAFLDIAAQEPRRCVVIDATPDQATVAKAVRAAVSERLNLQARSVA